VQHEAWQRLNQNVQGKTPKQGSVHVHMHMHVYEQVKFYSRNMVKVQEAAQQATWYKLQTQDGSIYTRQQGTKQLSEATQLSQHSTWRQNICQGSKQTNAKAQARVSVTSQ